jgi:hypothetical protein
MTYRYVGSGDAHIGNLKLEEYGQEVELSESEALNALAGGSALVPESKFTDDEVAMKYLAAMTINEVRESGKLPEVGNEVIE